MESIKGEVDLEDDMDDHMSASKDRKGLASPPNLKRSVTEKGTMQAQKLIKLPQV